MIDKLTVGDMRKAIEGVDDGMPIYTKHPILGSPTAVEKIEVGTYHVKTFRDDPDYCVDSTKTVLMLTEAEI